MIESHPAVVKVRADILKVHPFAQREVVPSRLKKLTDAMDLDAIGVLHAVIYRVNGQYGIWVIDGQHRLLALLALGFGEWIVEVKIHLDATTDARASELFLKLNDRSPVSAIDRFMNEVKFGDQDALGVMAIVKKSNLEVARYTGDTILNCVNALKRIYLLDGGKSLQRSFELVHAAWGYRSAALEGKILEGIGLLVGRHNGALDYEVLAKKLAKYSGGPSGLLGDAKGLRKYRKSSLPRCVAEVITGAYNVGRRRGMLDPL